MNGIIGRFLSFEKLIGASLIKILYYVGLAGIAFYMVVALFAALSIVGRAPMTALGMIVIIPILAVVGLLFWRFMCELYMILFRMSDDLHDVKNMLADKKD